MSCWFAAGFAVLIFGAVVAFVLMSLRQETMWTDDD